MGMGKSKIIEALRRLFHSHFYRPSNVSTNMRNGATFRGLLKPYETNNVQHTAKTHISYWCMCVCFCMCASVQMDTYRSWSRKDILYTRKNGAPRTARTFAHSVWIAYGTWLEMVTGLVTYRKYTVMFMSFPSGSISLDHIEELNRENC